MNELARLDDVEPDTERYPSIAPESGIRRITRAHTITLRSNVDIGPLTWPIKLARLASALSLVSLVCDLPLIQASGIFVVTAILILLSRVK